MKKHKNQKNNEAMEKYKTIKKHFVNIVPFYGQIIPIIFNKRVSLSFRAQRSEVEKSAKAMNDPDFSTSGHFVALRSK
jgi:hypothetical protein